MDPRTAQDAMLNKKSSAPLLAEPQFSDRPTYAKASKMGTCLQASNKNLACISYLPMHTTSPAHCVLIDLISKYTHGHL